MFNFLRRFFRPRNKPAVTSIESQGPPSEEDYQNEIGRIILRDPSCGMISASIDAEGNLCFDNGTVILAKDIPRNDNRIY